MLSDLGSQSHPEGVGVPFLPVWRRIVVQLAVLTVALSLVVMADALLRPRLDAQVGRALTLGLTPLPFLLWLAVSGLPESRASRPRRRLIGVAAVSAMAAASIGMPLVQDFFRVQDWLPLQSVFARILGYTLTAGVVDAGLKFVTLRYMTYPQVLQARADAFAYAFASAIGYSSVLSLTQIWELEPTLGGAALLLLSNFTIQLSSGMFVALGIAIAFFSDANPFALPLAILTAALTTGIITALAGSILSGPLSAAGSADRPILAIGLLAAALAVTVSAVYFLHANSERREREAYLSRRASDGI